MLDFHSTIPINNGKTPAAKVRAVHGLLTLSSSNKKKNLSKNLFKNSGNFGGSNHNKHVSVGIPLDYGLVKRDSFVKFAINAFQYLLYDNEVIPIPFQYFDRIYAAKHSQNTSSTTHSLTPMKKPNSLPDMFTNLNAVFDFMSALFRESSIEPTFVAMCLGDSIRFAKQIFSFNISDLNLCSKLADKRSEQIPLLTLNYLIKTFYKRLLNEAEESTTVGGPRKGGGGAFKSGKSTSVIFTVKISSQDIDQFEAFAAEKGSHCPAVSNRFQYVYRLGCTITKTTSFALSHHSGRDDFGIFNDSNNDDIFEDINEVEEVIEERLLEEEEAQLLNNSAQALDASDQSTSSDQNESTGSEKIKNGEDSMENAQQVEKKADDYIWVQIGAPIKCSSKM